MIESPYHSKHKLGYAVILVVETGREGAQNDKII